MTSAGTGSLRAPGLTGLLLILLAPIPLVGCLDGEAPVQPSPPSSTSGPEPETIVTPPAKFVTTLTPSDPDPAPAPRPDGLLFQVRRLSMTEVPIVEAFAEHVRADGLRPQPYLLASGANEGVTALLVAFETADESMLTGETATPYGPGAHLWVAVVVEPDEHLRHPDAALHAVLLEAFSSHAPIAAQLERWSRATRTGVQHVHLDVVENDAAIILDTDGPFSYRVTSEYAFATSNGTAQSMRLFGVAGHSVTGFIDLQFPERVWHAGHGIATKTDPQEITFPPAAGFSRLEHARGDATYPLVARYAPAPAAPAQTPDEQVLPFGLD